MCSCQQPGAHHFCRTGTQQCCAGGLQHAWADRAKQALMAWEGSEMTDHLGHPSAEGESSSLCLSFPERSRGDMITLFQGHSGASLGARGHIPSNGAAEGLVGLMVQAPGSAPSPSPGASEPGFLRQPFRNPGCLEGLHHPPTLQQSRGAEAEVHDTPCSAACSDAQAVMRTASAGDRALWCIWGCTSLPLQL